MICNLHPLVHVLEETVMLSYLLVSDVGLHSVGHVEMLLDPTIRLKQRSLLAFS